MESTFCFMGFLCLVAFEPGTRFYQELLMHGSSNTKVSCGREIFHEPEGHLSSPGYPHSPPVHPVSCQYIISVKSGFTISLNFTNFHIESASMPQDVICPYHWLQVTLPGSEPMKLCGGTSPGVMDTNSSRVTLDYHTDGKGLSKGWSLDYSTRRVKCPHPGRVANGTVPSLLTDFFYRDVFFVRCHGSHKLVMDGQVMERFSTKCQSNGQGHRRLPECKLIRCEKPKRLLNGWMKHISGPPNEYLSVIQHSCYWPFYTLDGHDNVNFTCGADGKWRSNVTNVTPSCTPVCGRPTKSVLTHQSATGLSDVLENAAPWHALVMAGGRRAGGTVIADCWLMTAAHILVHDGELLDMKYLQISVGQANCEHLNSNVLPASFHIHPGYHNSDRLTFNHDIALIKLSEVLRFSESVLPICLPTHDALYHTGTMGIVTGVDISPKRDRDHATHHLMYKQMPVVHYDACQISRNTMINTTGWEVPPMTDNMFCAGQPESVNDLGQYFSSAPFALQHNGSYWAAGLLSWGGIRSEPGEYQHFTKVINYMDWIRKTMQNN